MASEWVHVGTAGENGRPPHVVQVVRNTAAGAVSLLCSVNDITWEPETALKLAELLQRAAMPGQEGRRDDGEAAAAGVRGG